MSTYSFSAFRLNARCRSCDAPIFWVKSELGRWMPLDAEAVGAEQTNTFVVRNGETAIAVPSLVFPDEPHYVSHFSTCPDAAEWRKQHE